MESLQLSTVEPPPNIIKVDKHPPLQRYLGHREDFGGENNGRVAIIDVHTPLYLRGSNVEVGGGDLDDQQAFDMRAIKAGFRGIQFTPISDSADDPCSYCARSLFSYDPAVAALGRVPQLDGSNEYSRLCEMRREEYCESDHDRFDHNAIRRYRIKILKKLAFEGLSREEECSAR